MAPHHPRRSESSPRPEAVKLVYGEDGKEGYVPVKKVGNAPRHIRRLC
jgi:hypothetical protein